jgi:hypothetical protein
LTRPSRGLEFAAHLLTPSLVVQTRCVPPDSGSIALIETPPSGIAQHFSLDGRMFIAAHAPRPD